MAENKQHSVELTINSEKFSVSVDGKLSIERLLEIQDVESPDMVSVQHNGQILNREEFASIVVNDGDEINFLYFMGGGF